jgi:hypothetical protein
VGAAETFPITPQANVTIEGATTGTPTVVDVPTQNIGFTLGSSKAALVNLTIDGTSLAGNTGITVTGGTASLTTVTVQNLGASGIAVSGGMLTIGTSVSSSNNAGNGLNVTAGKVTISIPTGEHVATFDNNDYGIVIKGTGSITIGAATGQANPVADASSNKNAGLFIEQTPAVGTASPPANVIYYLHANTSVNSNGIHVYGGSTLTLRNSVTQGNAVDGILISTYTAGTTTSNDVNFIDLGSATDHGGNAFQYGEANSPNKGAGICLDLAATANQQLDAAGNMFEGVDCTTATTQLKTSVTCTGAVDYAIMGTGTTNSILVTTCK